MGPHQKYVEMMKSMKNTNVFKNVKKYFKEYSEFTGIHGLRFLTENRSIVEKLVRLVLKSSKQHK
jgi:hypothetical protein